MGFESFNQETNITSENNEMHYMTKLHSSQEEGVNGLTDLYEEYKGVKGNKLFDESKPFLSIDVDGKKFIAQYNAKYDTENSIHNAIYVQSADGRSVHIQELAKIMNRDIESISQELKDKLSN